MVKFNKFQWIAGGVCAIALSFAASQALAGGSAFTAAIVPVPTTYDGVNANGTPAIPPNAGSPSLTGVNICVGPGTTDDTCQGLSLCTATSCSGSGCLFANAGSTCTTNADCATGTTCVATSGPDGVGAEDAPVGSQSLNGVKSACVVKGTKIALKAVFNDLTFNTPLVAGTDKGSCQGGAICSADPVLGDLENCFGGTKNGKSCKGTGAAACTAGGGTCKTYCVAGPDKGDACTTDLDCSCAKSGDCGKDASKIPGTCYDGNEYVGEVNAVLGTSPTSSCLPCVLGIKELGTCEVGTCKASDPIRPGQVCQVDSDCFTGAGGCQLPNPTLPTNYAQFQLSIVHVVPLCPFQFRLSFPFEVKKGVGAVAENLATSSLGASVTSGTNVDVLSCMVREPGYTQISSLGMFTGTNARLNSYTGRAIPDLTVPLAGNSSGLHSNEGTGAIIGVTGGQAP